jgi:hypothetical protein
LSEHAPESTTGKPISKAPKINMSFKIAVFKRFSEVLVIDVVAKECADGNREVYMTI